MGAYRLQMLRQGEACQEAALAAVTVEDEGVRGVVQPVS